MLTIPVSLANVSSHLRHTDVNVSPDMEEQTVTKSLTVSAVMISTKDIFTDIKNILYLSI